MRLIALSIIFMLAACQGPPPGITKEKAKSHPQRCIQICVDHQFSNMHSTGTSWGTGSSSMNGMSQRDTYSLVRRGCAAIYEGKECCVDNDGYYGTYRDLIVIHHWPGIPHLKSPQRAGYCPP